MNRLHCFARYGAKSNADLLLFYGFTVPGNPYDEVPVTVQVNDACT